MLEGAFAFVILTKDRLYCVRDKYGLRPLSIGVLNGGYVVASETCALDICGATFLRDVNPGEVVVIDDSGLHSYDYSKYKHRNMCAMEYIYFQDLIVILKGLMFMPLEKNPVRFYIRKLLLMQILL